MLPREQSQTSASFPAGLVCTAYVAFSVSEALAGRSVAELAAEAEQALTESEGVAIRGAYATSGLRADCDLLRWLAAYPPRGCRRRRGRCTARSWVAS
jgi:hypothetical protein